MTEKMTNSERINGGREKRILRTIYGGKEMPFAKAVVLGRMVYCSGFGGIDPETGNVVSGITEKESVKKQAALTVKKIQSVLREVGTDLQHIVQALIIVEKFEYWDTCLEVFKEMGMPMEDIAQTLVEAKLKMGIFVEVQATAYIPA